MDNQGRRLRDLAGDGRNRTSRSEEGFSVENKKYCIIQQQWSSVEMESKRM
jgi:hypothetical protein